MSQILSWWKYITQIPKWINRKIKANWYWWFPWRGGIKGEAERHISRLPNMLWLMGPSTHLPLLTSIMTSDGFPPLPGGTRRNQEEPGGTSRPRLQQGEVFIQRAWTRHLKLPGFPGTWSLSWWWKHGTHGTLFHYGTIHLLTTVATENIHMYFFFLSTFVQVQDRFWPIFSLLAFYLVFWKEKCTSYLLDELPVITWTTH